MRTSQKLNWFFIMLMFFVYNKCVVMQFKTIIESLVHPHQCVFLKKKIAAIFAFLYNAGIHISLTQCVCCAYHTIFCVGVGF
jgi:hypothetical protein